MVNVPKWKKWTIGEMILQTKTTIQTGPFGTVLSASEFVNYGIPVISVREIREGFIRITDETPCVTDETFYRLGKYALSANDIVFARKGSVDRSAVIPDSIERYFLGSDGIRIRFDENVVNPHLMLYIFQNPSAKQFLIQSSYGTTMAGLNEKILSALEFYLPETIEEQKRVAQVLTDIDRQLALTEKMIAKKKAIKQGAMQELLTGKKRLLGFTGEWQHSCLGESAELSTTTISSKPIDSRYYVGTDNMVADRGGVKDNELSLTYANVREYKAGDVLLSNIRPYLKKIWYATRNGGCSNDVLVIRRKNTEELDSVFLYYILAADAFFDEIMAYAVGTKMPRGDKSVIKSYKICFPKDISEQQAIAEILSNMDAEIEALEQKLAKYRQVKQGMMQQLLTGKIRLV